MFTSSPQKKNPWSTGVELLTPPESAGGSHISVMEVLERLDSPKFGCQTQRYPLVNIQKGDFPWLC